MTRIKSWSEGNPLVGGEHVPDSQTISSSVNGISDQKNSQVSVLGKVCKINFINQYGIFFLHWGLVQPLPGREQNTTEIRSRWIP